MSYGCLYTGERKIKFKKLNILVLKQDEYSLDSLVSYQNRTAYSSLKDSNTVIGQWIGLIVFVISLYILWQIRQVLLLIFAAVVLATTLNRLARFIQRFGIKRGIAIAVSIGFLIIMSVGFFAVIVPPFIKQLQELVDLVPTSLGRLRNWTD